MTVVKTDEFTGGLLAFEITGVASTDAAAQGSIANPFGASVNVLRAFVVPSVESTGSADLSIGVTTVAAAATDLLNALDMNGVTIGKAIMGFAITGAKATLAPAIWTSAKFITLTASATMVGFVGTLYLEVIPTSVANA